MTNKICHLKSNNVFKCYTENKFKLIILRWRIAVVNNSINFNNHPFKFLLYLEWGLLLIAALTEFIFQGVSRFPLLTFVTWSIFAAMGLRLPKNNQPEKVIYIVTEILLISLAGFSSNTQRLFAFLYLIMVIRSCLIFELLGRITVSFISFILCSFTFLQIFYYREYVENIAEEVFRKFFPLNVVLSFGLVFLFVVLFMNAIISERQSREELVIANEKLRQYSLKIENQATLEERSRIAREIHDSLGHSLTALNLQLETAIKLWKSNPTKAESFLSQAKKLGTQALQDVRHSVSTLRSDPLHDQSLDRAIAILVENFQNTTNVLPKCQIKIEHTLSVEISTAIYRIIQESLTNISKHAQATAVTLKINTTSKNLLLIIQDNGKGFDLEENTTGFGLKSIGDRTLALKGNFNIKTTPNCGCEITVDIPLSK